MALQADPSAYVGRMAPTPSGFLHLGHAATFHTVWTRARDRGGRLLLRLEDLDQARCKPEFAAGMMEDLCWLGLDWDEGPVFQSERRASFFQAWQRLRDDGWIYPCRRSRKDVAQASVAPHEDEPVFPRSWRGNPQEAMQWEKPAGVNWRFCVPDEEIVFVDGRSGEVRRVGQRDFGDFLIWNQHDIPAYELAVVVDDIAQGITEVVRGGDLLTSTARQLLIYRALSAPAPAFYHCPLVLDESGKRLAKRHEAKSIKKLREEGMGREDVLALAAAR